MADKGGGRDLPALPTPPTPRSIVATLRSEDPLRRLTFTAARTRYAGDSNLLRRIHAFLESWQLINYAVPPQRWEPSAPLGAAGQLPPHLVRAQPAGIDALLRLPRRVPPAVGGAAAAAGGGGAGRVVERLPAAAAGVLSEPAAASGARFCCGALGCQADCTALRYHCTKQPGLDLCPACYKGELQGYTVVRQQRR